MFWAPDSQSLAFFAAGKLKRVDLACWGSRHDLRGSSVGPDARHVGSRRRILLGLSYGTAISSVPAAGGSPRDILTPNHSSGERRVHWPWFLP